MKIHTILYLYTMEKTPAYYQLLEISDALRGTTYMRTMIAESYGDNSLIRSDTGSKTSTIKNEFTQVTLDCVENLSNPAALFVIRNIISQLKRYNLLWHRPTTRKSSEKVILKELIDNHILFRTETLGIYLVNPLKIWRGTIHSAVEATKTLLRDRGKPSLDMIKDLKPNSDYLLLTEEDRFNKMISG